jgi:hypothetical protein
MHTFKLRHAALLMILAGLSGGASCVSDGGDTYDHRTGNDDYNRNDRYDTDRPGRIPRRADIVRDGTGKLKWTADMDGTVYVYDQTRDAIRYTGPVRRGQEIIVQPNDNQIQVDGRTVYDEDLKSDATHQIYFAATDSNYRRDRDGRDRDSYGRSDSREALPYGAKRLERSDGDIDIRRVPQTGTLYIYDETEGQTLLRTNIRKGTRFGIDAREGRIYIDGEAGQRIKLPRGHTVGVYLAEW